MSETVTAETAPRRPRRRWNRHDWIRLGVVLWFVLCWYIGSTRGQVDIDPFFALAWPEATATVRLEDDLFEAGLDSMAIMQLLLLIEENFGVDIPASELSRENFSTAKAIAQLIRSRRENS